MDGDTQDKKADAMQATLELIAKQGFHATPMSQIAEHASIGVGTIYRYFKDKDDLINALYIDVKSRISRYILQSYSEDMPVRDSFKQLMNNTIHYFKDNPEELSFAEQYENSPLITTDTHEKVLKMVKPAFDIFKRAVEQNLLKDLPVEVLGSLISGATISLAKLYMTNTENIDEVSLEAGIDAIWDMIKK